MNQRWDPDLFVKAWDFATFAHADQTYSGPAESERIPYLNHIGAVAMEVMGALAIEDQLDGDLAVQCAVLHDVIEDTTCAYDEILRAFGERVADGVAALTKDERMASKREQIEDSLQRIQHQPKEIWIVKMADRITNLSEPPYHWDSEMRRNYRQGARLIHEALKSAHSLLADRLDAKIRDYVKYCS